MSTHTAAPSVAALEQELNQLVLQGQILPAFDRFYAENVVMQENNSPASEGKAANRIREEQFVDSIAQFHHAALLGSATSGNRSFSEWVMDVTFKNGIRVKLEQVAVRQWEHGQVVHERFYYNASNA
jgi:SnoaL-like domain